jgi:hypothetical protein
MGWRYLIVISSMHFHDKLTCPSSEGCEAFEKQRAACHAVSMPSPEVSPREDYRVGTRCRLEVSRIVAQPYERM